MSTISPASTQSRRSFRQPVEQLGQAGVRPDFLQLLSASILVFAPPIVMVYAVIHLWGHGISWLDVGLAVGMYTITGHGVTIGFHRHLSHGAFRACRPLRLALLIAGSMSIQGGVITWVSQHRKHHAFSDREGDPHSPHRYGSAYWAEMKGLIYAHVGWFFASNYADAKRWAPDLVDDRDIAFVSKTAMVWTLLSLAIPFGIAWAVTGTIAGAGLGLVWGGVVRICVLHHMTFSTNSICHMFGRHPYRTGDRSGNVAPLALFSMGESWHNAHHAFPALARHGVDRGQLDSSATLIRLFERLGWVSHVRWPKPERLASRRMVRGSSWTDDQALDAEVQPGQLVGSDS